MLRKSAVAAAVAMLFALPALAQNPPAAPPVRVRGTIEKVDGAYLTVKAREGMDVKVAVTDATRVKKVHYFHAVLQEKISATVEWLQAGILSPVYAVCRIID